MRSLLRILMVLALAGCARPSSEARAQDDGAQGDRERPERFSTPPIGQRLELSESEWRRRLTPAEFRILREQGTEPAFRNRFHDHHERGTYRCAGCGAPLFHSAQKFDSGTGWPSFWRPIEEGRVARELDARHGMERTEVHCARCGGHLGHVFDDGPEPTGLRYCVNSAALDFEAQPH